MDYQEILTAAMPGHQKYFSTLSPDGQLAPKFIFISNVDVDVGNKAIVMGNERSQSALVRYKIFLGSR